MIKKHSLFTIIFVICHFKASANFDYNENCITAYKAILSLRMSDAQRLIAKEKQQNIQNGIIVLLENYIDYFTLLSSENKIDYERLKDARSGKIAALENNSKSSPYYLFAQAEIYMQWSFLKAKFGDYVSSAYDAKKAESLLNENVKKYPDFLPDQINIALVNVIFGSIPANFKSITRFLGMNGNAQTGIKQLEDLRIKLPKTKYSFYNDEVVFLICTIDVNVLHNIANYNKLIGYLDTMEDESLLKVYLKGYVAAKIAHNDDAVVFLEDMPKSGQYIHVPAISYLLGNAKLNRMDADADTYLLRYINEFKGINLIKDTYLKLAYFYLIHDDLKKYSYYINFVKTKGYAIDEKDKQALREANDAEPDIDLLKTRFYFDGGYYNKALAQIINKNISGFKTVKDKTEFYYRLGRIYDKTNKPYEAVVNYQKAISIGKITKYYYAANSALRAGDIFEQLKDYNKAADFYYQALDMKDHEYQTSIDNDAKAGLKRIGR